MSFFTLPNKEKKLIIKDLAQKTNLPEAPVEKDWWVVQALRIVFEMETSSHMVFKGGTSLSKAWDIIKRFSEDIDLALAQEFLGFPSDISRTQIKEKLRPRSVEYISGDFFEKLKHAFSENGFENLKFELKEIKSSDQDPVKIFIWYPTVADPSIYVQPKIELEIGSRSLQEPFTVRKIKSFLAEHYPKQEFADPEIEIPSVNPERTFLEKLFLLHEEFQRPTKERRVDRLSRHLYDIDQISKTKYKELAFANPDLFKEIVEHRYKYNRINKVDYSNHFPPNLNPFPPKEILELWEKDYKTMQTEMMSPDTIPFEELIDNIRKMIDEFNEKGF